MRYLLKLIVIGLLAGLQVGCTTSFENITNCHDVNWEKLGKRDGEQGHYRSAFKARFPNCGAALEQYTNTYLKAWKLGTQQYCTPNHMMHIGQSGKMYNHICPAEQSQALNRAWVTGLRTFCTEEHGYALGLTGQADNTYCRHIKSTRFENGYRAGLKKHKTIQHQQAALKTINTKIDAEQHKLDMATQQLNANKARYANTTFDPDTQYNLSKQTRAIKKLTQSIHALQKVRDDVMQKNIDSQ